MTRQQLNSEVSKYFKASELVCSHIHRRYGSGSYYYMDSRILEVLLWIKRGINLPITVNDWKTGGTLSQRGYRCNLCDMVKQKNQVYLSAHTRGQAVDFDVKGMTAEDVRKWIEKNKRNVPHPIRIEKGTSWVHIDVCNESGNRIVYFTE